MHVEDEMIVSMAVRTLLEKNGHTVCGQPASGESALELFERLQPDVVLMDIMLGGELDGVETARRIKGKRDVPVIFVSAYGDEKTRARAEAVHPLAFLIKPLDMRVLLRTLDDLPRGNGSGQAQA